MLDNNGREHKIFGFVVDGELGWVHTVDETVEQLIAVMRSNPQVIEISDEQYEMMLQSEHNLYSYTYDGTQFNPPTES